MIPLALKKMGLPEVLLNSLLDVASNGQEAVDSFKALCETPKRYSLIFMDCSMPHKDGYTASKEIREFCDSNKIAQPYIMACTGHTEPMFVKKAFDNLMDELIAKPVTVDKLIPVFQQFIKVEE